MKKVLFVCLGNICRSPAAEGVFTKLVAELGLQQSIQVDSCGTLNHHEGENADHRMREHARLRGYDLTSIARGIESSDLDEFDYIITMDDSNFNDVLKITTDPNRHKVRKMMDFSTQKKFKEVPDPYYGGPEGFETVLDLLEDSCKNLLEEIRK